MTRASFAAFFTGCAGIQQHKLAAMAPTTQAGHELASDCQTCSGPQFSWDTLPVAFHSCEPATNEFGEFSEAQLDTIQKFPLVTIEKWQGVRASTKDGKRVFLWEEDAFAAAAKGVKSRRPDATVIAWLDSLRVYTGWKWPIHRPYLKASDLNTTFNPDITKDCAFGHFRAAEFLETHGDDYLLHNNSGLKAIDSYGNCHLHDFTKEAPRKFWKEMCLNLTKSGVIDGCGADVSHHLASMACHQKELKRNGGKCNRTRWGLDMEMAKAYDSGRHSMLRETTDSLGDGLLVGKDPRELYDPSAYGEDQPYVNAVLHEGCDANEDTIYALQNITAASQRTGKRLVYQCHTYCHFGKGEQLSQAEVCRDNVAAFMIGAGRDQYFVVGRWENAPGITQWEDGTNFSTHWIPGLFDRPLGEPLANGVKDPETGIWSREFATGTRVTFDPNAPGMKRGDIQWAK